MRTIHISASDDYDVCIGSGLIGACGDMTAKVISGRRAMLVSDRNVAALYLDSLRGNLLSAGFSCETYVVPAGEASKNVQNYLELISALARNHFTRADAVIALGGGVIGDLAGFAAATYLRGIHLVQLPTTLLACVDSSVGGKTAVNLPEGKNLLGAFKQPRLVICDLKLLDTLPESVYAEGCAEVIKYGMYGNARLLGQLAELRIREQQEDVIAACVAMKRDAVEKDEFDRSARQVLNFGHTFAHAIERLSNYTIPHGSAVAVGMRIMTRAAVNKGFCDPLCARILDDLLVKYQLPTETKFSAREIAEAALADKKRMGETMTLIIPTKVGESDRIQIELCALEDWARAGLSA